MSSENLLKLNKTIVLVGLMGAGKSCIGSRLAERLNLPFVDADDEIEKAAGCSISDIFDSYGEEEFRAGERRVIARLLQEPQQIIATGGGAFMDEETRAAIAASAISVWLRADLDLLVARTTRRTHRPLLQGSDHRARLKALMEERHPVYETADIVVDSARESPDVTVDRLFSALETWLEKQPEPCL